MASFEDYDEFGNYIGADLESDEEDEIQRDQFLRQEPQQRETMAPLEGYEGEAEGEAGAVGMEVDGMSLLSILVDVL
jgi:U5 small nuclear ribonucleoprotein component